MSKQLRLWGAPVTVKQEKGKKEPSGLKINHLSYSSIRDYLTCPKLFYYKHILKLRLKQKAMELVFGGAVHDSLEAFHKGQDPHATFDEKFDVNKLLPEEKIAEDIDLHIKWGHDFINTYIESQEYFKTYHQIHPEGTSEESFDQWIKDPITNELYPLKILGRIDRVTKAVQILEFKTSSKPYKQEEIDTGMQPSVYGLAHFAKTGIYPKEYIYIVFIKGKKELQVLKTTRSKEQLSYAFKMMELVYNGIKAASFPQGKGWKHKWCDCLKFEDQLLIK